MEGSVSALVASLFLAPLIMMVRTYEHSGQVGVLGIPFVLIGGGVTSILLGTIYPFALAILPSIYISFLLTCGLGMGIGFSVGGSSKAGKIRSEWVPFSCGLIFGAVGLYVAWAFDPAVKLRRGFQPMLNPGDLFDWMKYCYSEGTWGFWQNEPITGIFLVAVWIVESIIVFGLSSLLAAGIAAGAPFCEDCMVWTKVQENFARLIPPEGDPAALDQLCAGEIRAVENFQKAPPDVETLIRLDTAHCPECDCCNCLTVKRVESAEDRSDDSPLGSETLVRHMLISGSDFEFLTATIEEMDVDS